MGTGNLQMIEEPNDIPSHLVAVCGGIGFPRLAARAPFVAVTGPFQSDRSTRSYGPSASAAIGVGRANQKPRNNLTFRILPGAGPQSRLVRQRGGTGSAFG